MMKRLLILVLSLLMLVFCIPALAESTDWNYDANYAILRGYDGAGGDVVVPAEIDGFTVDVIGINVFKGDTITSLTLPETVLELQQQRRLLVRKSGQRYAAPEPCGHQPHEFLQLQCAERGHHSRGRALHRRHLVQILRRAAQDHLRGRVPGD